MLYQKRFVALCFPTSYFWTGRQPKVGSGEVTKNAPWRRALGEESLIWVSHSTANLKYVIIFQLCYSTAIELNMLDLICHPEP